MANHIRQQIREALGTQLTGLATTGANVFQTRIYPIEDDELPCLTISNESEENEYLNLNIPRTVQRFITISVKAVVKDLVDTDDKLDTICNEVEKAIAADITISNLAKNTRLASTEITIEKEGEKPVGVADMSFIFEAFTNETTPDVAII